MQNRNYAKNLIRRRVRMRSRYVLPQEVEKHRAILLIQRWYKWRKWFNTPRKKISSHCIIIQKCWRGFMGRKEAYIQSQMLMEAAAIIIQLFYRDYKERQFKKIL